MIATRSAYLVEDLRALVPADFTGTLPVLSALSVPMMAGDELLGTLSVGAETPNRFHLADQRLVAIVAGQIAVAVQNARLHDSVGRGKREWEQTFDAIADPIAVFDGRGGLLRGNTALALHLGRRVTELRGSTCAQIGFCNGERASTARSPARWRTTAAGPRSRCPTARSSASRRSRWAAGATARRSCRSRRTSPRTSASRGGCSR